MLTIGTIYSCESSRNRFPQPSTETDDYDVGLRHRQREHRASIRLYGGLP